jgi:hypothetical protein
MTILLDHVVECPFREDTGWFCFLVCSLWSMPRHENDQASIMVQVSNSALELFAEWAPQEQKIVRIRMVYGRFRFVLKVLAFQHFDRAGGEQ